MSSVNLVKQHDIFKQFMKWLLKNGAKFSNIYIEHYSDTFRGIKVSKFIKKNSNIVKIPYCCIMNVKKAKECEIGKIVLQSKYRPSNDHIWLSLFLLNEKNKRDSFYEPYIKTIPQNFKDYPHFFTKKDYDILKGSLILDMIKSRKHELQEDFNELKSNFPEFFKSIKFGKYMWSRIAVISRIFGSKNNEESGFVPLADMLNHSVNPGTEWTFLEKEKCFVIKNHKPFFKSFEIFDTYGPKCNSRYFVNYGFTLPDNKENTAQLFIDVKEIIPNPLSFQYQKKLELIKTLDKKNFDNGYSGYSLLIHKKIEKKVTKQNKIRFQITTLNNSDHVYQLFGLFRVIYMNQSEIDQLQSILSENNLSQILHIIPHLDMDREINILINLKKICEDRLSEFSTQIDTDVKKKKEQKEFSKEWNIYESLISEKNVLIYYIKLADYVTDLFTKSRYNETLFFKNIKKTEMGKEYSNFLKRKS